MSYKKGHVYACNPTTARGVATKLHAHKDKIVYTNGKTVIIRDLTNPNQAVTYSQHVHPATVARISPSGYYCASGDAQGNVRIWDIAGEDQILKLEAKPISGRINDLAWDGESKRIIAVGDGREKYGHAFMFDTGSSAGEIIGHQKVVNSVSIRHERPFRAATAGDDNLIIFHHGAPYKYDKTIKTHTRFVQEVKFAPSGAVFASVGSDSKIFLYDGKTGDTVAEVKDSPHTGSIMALSWSPDSSHFVTSSADRTVKLWDAQTQKEVGRWGVGNGLMDQQVGNAWVGADSIISLSMSGDLNVYDRRQADKPRSIIYGPSKSITASVLSVSSPPTFYAGSYDGRITAYSAADGNASSVGGDAHSNQVSGLTTAGGKVISVGFDDYVREVDGSKMSAISPTNGQPRGVAGSEDGTAFVVTTSAIEVIKDKKKSGSLNVNYGPSAVAVAPGGKLVAIGGEDQKVYLYTWDGSNLKETAKLEANRGIISSLAFSPSGKHLVAGDSSGKILLYDPSTKETITSRWSYHSGRVNSLAFSPNGKRIASGALDTHVYIWDVDQHSKNIPIKNAGPGGVNAVCWVGEKTVWSTGADGCIRSWEIAV